MPRLLLLLLSTTAAASQAATLTAYATLPADTFTPGPTSGQFIEAANGRQTPFSGQQPVQGFSALLKGENGSYYALSDNGFGRRDNSSDYLLSIYRLRPDFRTASGGSGTINVEDIIHLSDPDGYLPYTATLAPDRLLTGADLDPESFQKAMDGSYWVGEEFIPALVHFSATGAMLAPPVQLTGLVSAGNPMGLEATLPRSRGFEGMAISPGGDRLYPMLEGALTGGQQGLNIYTFDVAKQHFINDHANRPSARYRLDEGATAIGDFTLYSATQGLVIERDSRQGDAAVIKKIYKVSFEQLDADGFMIKSLVADLLNISDPNDLNRDGSKHFTFPFWTIEGLLIIDHDTLGIVNDNNYPFGQARKPVGTLPDNNELILIDIEPLWE